MDKKFATKWYKTTDSTNNEMLRQAGSLDNMTVFAAEYQTAGRGQRGNSWKADAGKNLTFSVFLRFATEAGGDGDCCPPIDAARQFGISEIAAIAQCRFLGRHGISARIKWPNDIYAGDGKISGMLVENTLSGHSVRTSVIGIGLNVNQTEFPASLPNPVSMTLLTGRHYSLPSLLEDFLSELAACLDLLRTPAADLNDLYEKYMYRLGIPSRFIDLSSRPAWLPADPVFAGEDIPSFSGIIRGITPEGRLLLELHDGSVRSFAFKEIAYVIP